MAINTKGNIKRPNKVVSQIHLVIEKDGLREYVSSEVSAPSHYINSLLTHNPLFALVKG